VNDSDKIKKSLGFSTHGAPWSNQRVGLIVRVLAWVFVLTALFAISSFTYFSIKEGIPDDQTLESFAVAFGTLYITALFARVAISGRAPSGWLPWK